MTWAKHYADHLAAGGPDILKAHVYKPGRYSAVCLSCHTRRESFRLVDVSMISPAVVDVDWACDVCWTAWIRKGGSLANSYHELHLQVNEAADLGIAVRKVDEWLGGGLDHFDRIKDRPQWRSNGGGLDRDLHSRLVAARDRGLVMRAARFREFTKSQFAELRNAPADYVQEIRGTRFDYMP